MNLHKTEQLSNAKKIENRYGPPSQPAVCLILDSASQIKYSLTVVITIYVAL